MVFWATQKNGPQTRASKPGKKPWEGHHLGDVPDSLTLLDGCFGNRTYSRGPLKTNMSVENQWLEDIFPTEIVRFRGHVSFGGCTSGFLLGISGCCRTKPDPLGWVKTKNDFSRKNIGNLLSKDPGRKFAKLQFLESYWNVRESHPPIFLVPPFSRSFGRRTTRFESGTTTNHNSLKLTLSLLKMDGWNTTFIYFPRVSAYFQGLTRC